MKINAIQNHWISINFIGDPKETFLFVPLVWSYFWHVLAFQACYGLLLVVRLFTSDEVTNCFDLQIYYKSTSTKQCRSYYKRNSFFELQSGVIGRKQISISTLMETDLIHYLQMRTWTSKIFVKIFLYITKNIFKYSCCRAVNLSKLFRRLFSRVLLN